MQLPVTAVRVVGGKIGALHTSEGHWVRSYSEYTKLGRVTASVIIFLRDLGSNTYLPLRRYFFGGYV
jgi:hypothetical protein